MRNTQRRIIKSLDRVIVLITLVLIVALVSLTATAIKGISEYLQVRDSSSGFADAERREALADAVGELQAVLINGRPAFPDCRTSTETWIEEAKAEAEARVILSGYKALAQELQLAYIIGSIERLTQVYSEIIYACDDN